MKGKTAKGHVVKHTKKATAKHHSAKAKHHPTHHAKAATHHKAKVHAKAKHPAHAKATGLALAPGDVACCGAEALAASLRLGGLSVPDAEMLDLFWRAGGHPDKGLPISELLDAASEIGLAGYRLEDTADLLDHSEREFRLSAHQPDQAATALSQLGFDDLPCAGEQHIFTRNQITWLAAVHLGQEPARDVGAGREPLVESRSVRVHSPSLILGLDLPGAHAVLATPEGWWSWGELWCPFCEFPDAVIEEAWAVTWG